MRNRHLHQHCAHLCHSFHFRSYTIWIATCRSRCILLEQTQGTMQLLSWNYNDSTLPKRSARVSTCLLIEYLEWMQTHKSVLHMKYKDSVWLTAQLTTSNLSRKDSGHQYQQPHIRECCTHHLYQLLLLEISCMMQSRNSMRVLFPDVQEASGTTTLHTCKPSPQLCTIWSYVLHEASLVSQAWYR